MASLPEWVDALVLDANEQKNLEAMSEFHHLG